MRKLGTPNSDRKKQRVSSCCSETIAVNVIRFSFGCGSLIKMFQSFSREERDVSFEGLREKTRLEEFNAFTTPSYVLNILWIQLLM